MVTNEEQWCAPVRRPRPPVATGIAGFAVVLVWGLITTGNTTYLHADQQVLVLLNAHHNFVFDVVGRALSVIFAPTVSTILVVVVAVLCGLLTRSVRKGLFVGIGIGLTYLGLFVVKVVVARPRPEALAYVVPGVVTEHGQSYPSGHTGIAAAMVVILVLSVPKLYAKWTIAIVGGVTVVLTALSRMYVGAHYPDDVTASIVYTVTVGPAVYTLICWLDTKIPAWEHADPSS